MEALPSDGTRYSVTDLIPVGLWHYLFRVILRLFWLSASASPLLIPMQPKKESLSEFVCSDDFLLVVPAKRNEARGTVTVHLTSSGSVKLSYNFINMWMPQCLILTLKDCHLVWLLVSGVHFAGAK